jgi:hypothetical protein
MTLGYQALHEGVAYQDLSHRGNHCDPMMKAAAPPTWGGPWC